MPLCIWIKLNTCIPGSFFSIKIVGLPLQKICYWGTLIPSQVSTFFCTLAPSVRHLHCRCRVFWVHYPIFTLLHCWGLSEVSPCNFGTYKHQVKTESKTASTLWSCTSLLSKCPTWWPRGNLVVSAAFDLEKENIFDSWFEWKYEIFSSISKSLRITWRTGFFCWKRIID